MVLAALQAKPVLEGQLAASLECRDETAKKGQKHACRSSLLIRTGSSPRAVVGHGGSDAIGVPRKHVLAWRGSRNAVGEEFTWFEQWI